MRVLAIWILALGFAASPAFARAAGTGDDKKDSTSTAKKKDPAKDATAATPAPATEAKGEAAAKPVAASMETELQQLRELLEAQSKQLQEQNEALKEQQRDMEIMRENLKAVNAPLENEGAAPASSFDPGPASGYVAASADKDEPPTTIHFKGVTLTPGGFFAAEAVYRQRGITNDVNTDPKSIPFSGASNAHLNDLNFSGRQSQISMLVQGKLDGVKIGGYYEGDFLSAGTTSNNNESNSYTFRQRQFWAQAAFDSGWTITGGQMWSLVTETKKGTQPLTEARPTTIDAQYTAGFSWARQFGIRFSKAFDDNKITLAMSVEGPQTTLGGKIQTQNTLIAAPGDLGGLYNSLANYSYNQTPDIVVKAAFDPGWGHYEIFGVISTFRARLFPCAGASAIAPCPINDATNSGSLANNSSNVGGGIGANARAPFFNKKLDVGLHFLGGNGVARYGNTTLADVTVRPNGSLVPLRSYQALLSLEFHATPKLDFYGYAGGEYDGKAAYVDSLGRGVGYGSPLNSNAGCSVELSPTNQNTPTAPAACEGDIRNFIQGTFGFWYRFYNGPKGRVQSGLQYSYDVKNTWGANAGGSPHAIDNMVFTSFRYYLP